MSFTCGNLSIFFSNVKETARDMRQQKIYEADDKMINLIKDNYNVLQSLGCFGISLGFGDKTVSQVCEEQQVDTTTFLAVVNYTINGERPDISSLNLSLPTLLRYLKASHDYYTGFQLPFIRKELNDAIDPTNNLGKLIMKLYDQYSHSITSHMKYEERNVFPYVEQLMNGTPDPAYDIDTYSKHHGQETDKLYELKSIIIKYLPSDGLHNNKLSATLYDIYNNEDWLRLHAEVEEYFFIPAIRQIEEKNRKGGIGMKISGMLQKSAEGSELLGEREKEVIVALVQGMSNKQIADHLCISTNTVITHRRNIARKLQIHSAAGLTIYAIVNNLVDISMVKL